MHIIFQCYWMEHSRSLICLSMSKYWTVIFRFPDIKCMQKPEQVSLYGKQKWLEQMFPVQYGGGMVLSVDFDNTTFADLPFRFEAGTQYIAGAISIAAAIDYMNDIGINAIHSTKSNCCNTQQMLWVILTR